MYLFTSNIWSNAYAAWYKFMKDEFKLESQIGVMLDSWNELYMNSGVYSAIFTELVCVVSKYPKAVHIDDEKRMHNPKGPAVEWGASTDFTQFDGYYIHGRQIEEKLMHECLEGQVTKERFMGEKNEEVRGAMYEILGQEKIMSILGAALIDKKTVAHANGDIETLDLYKTKEKFRETGGNPLAWIKFVCPSTGSNYLIDVEPHHTDALEAAISTSPLFTTKEEYSFSDRT